MGSVSYRCALCVLFNDDSFIGEILVQDKDMDMFIDELKSKYDYSNDSLDFLFGMLETYWEVERAVLNELRLSAKRDGLFGKQMWSSMQSRDRVPVHGIRLTIGANGGFRLFGVRNPFVKIADPIKAIRYTDGYDPEINVYEEGDHVVIEAKMPGIKRGDVRVECSEIDVTIDAVKSKKFYENMLLPYNYLDAPRAKATYRNGVLEIRIPITEKCDWCSDQLKYFDVEIDFGDDPQDTSTSTANLISNTAPRMDQSLASKDQKKDVELRQEMRIPSSILDSLFDSITPSQPFQELEPSTSRQESQASGSGDKDPVEDLVRLMSSTYGISLSIEGVDSNKDNKKKEDDEEEDSDDDDSDEPSNMLYLISF